MTRSPANPSEKSPRGAKSGAPDGARPGDRTPPKAGQEQQSASLSGGPKGKRLNKTPTGTAR